jgi:hypothetical protein
MRAALLILATLAVAPIPALADSQSSNSSSNCSNGRCSRVESYSVEDRWGQRGWVREERWRERGERRRPEREWRGGYGQPYYWAPPRRGRDRDGDDD